MLLGASAAKAVQLTTEPLAEQGWLTSRWTLLGATQAELLTGLALFFYPRQARILAQLTFAVLACLAAYKTLSGVSSCGCFGSAGEAIKPWHVLIFDLGALAALRLWTPSPCPLVSGSGSKAHVVRLAGFVALLLIGSVGSVVGAARFSPTTLGADGLLVGNGNHVVLEPENWVGKPLPILPYVEISEDLSQGDWLVCLYHADCPKCQALLPVLDQRARHGQRVALISVPANGHGQYASIPADSPMTLGRLTEARDWFVSTPALLALSGGTVSRLLPTPEAGCVAEGRPLPPPGKYGDTD